LGVLVLLLGTHPAIQDVPNELTGVDLQGVGAPLHPLCLLSA
jgi:hypothetical protein